MQGPVRRAAVAGSWYPGTAAEIVSEVEACLGRVPPLPRLGRLVALISPHAGLRYSGPVAAYGYSLLRGLSDVTVVLVGPSHRAPIDGVAVFARGSFLTPLGPVPVDAALARAMLDPDHGVVDAAEPHLHEHSLEMQLPFLQHLLPGLRIVPALMGTQSRSEVEHLVRAVVRGVRAHPALLLASSDLSHYHPAPVANQLDALVVGDVERFDAEALMDRIERSWGTACGGGPMVAVMKAARELGANRASVLRYADSGDAGERDKSRVVGYLSAALWEA